MAEPDPDDLSSLAVSLYTSSLFPLNLILLAVAFVALFALLCLVAAAAEVALLRNAEAGGANRVPFSRAILTAFAITLLSALPAAGAAGLLATGVIAVGPTEFQSPDIGTPILLRLAGVLLPLLVLMLIAILVGQAFGGLAIRAAHAAPERPVKAALASAARSLVRRPLKAFGVAGGGMLVDALSLIFTFALLRVLWAPIAAALAEGRLTNPGTLLLLLGFVAIWMALLLVAGALHVAVSAWWAMELARGRRGEAH
jgi:hypothetical protein